MTQLVYGKEDQVEFKDAAEKAECFDYLIHSDNVEFHHEPNHLSGARASEKRIHFRTDVGVPAGLVNNFTAGRPGIAGRINCGELYDEIAPLRIAARGTL